MTAAAVDEMERPLGVYERGVISDDVDAADSDIRSGGRAGSSLAASASGVMTLVGPVRWGGASKEGVVVGGVAEVAEEPNEKSAERRLCGDGGDEVDRAGVWVPEVVAVVEVE